MTEPTHSTRPTSAKHEKPAVPPMRDAGPDTPSGSLEPGGGAVVDPRATDPGSTGKPEPAAELAFLKQWFEEVKARYPLVRFETTWD